MTSEEYKELLSKAPAQNTPEFLEYVRKNSVLEWESMAWLVVRNVKYWTPENDWLTAFYKFPDLPAESLLDLLYQYGDREWLKKTVARQTVPNRFHIHFYNK